MKKTKQTKTLSVSLLSALLVAAMLICAVGCGEKDTDAEVPETSRVTTTAADLAGDSTGTDTRSSEEGGVISLGKGAAKFTFSVVDGDGKETLYEIATDADTVGDALLDLGLIEGEEGQYGLYVKKVCGITADYDKTGTYWAFYIDGEYAMSGVDTTTITPGATYSFKVEK